MEMSENTGDLFTAYANFQGELSSAGKSKAGHGYKYADLAECIWEAKDLLKANGLAVAQFMGQSDGGTTLTTMLTHSSGQWMRDTFLMERAVLQGGAGKNPAQAMGASITYMRRYAYAAILGMAQEDEDAKGVRDGVADIKSAVSSGNGKWLLDNWNTLVQNSWGGLDVITQNEVQRLAGEASTSVGGNNES